MLEGLIAGETDARKLAALGHPRLRATPAELVAALTGRVTAHHRMMLRLHLDHINAIDTALATIDAQADANLDPFREAAELIQSVDGIGELAARGILAEIGLDMSRFPTHGHLLSWAGLVPRNDESAGKRRSTKLRKGGTWLKTLLVQCAWAAVRKKNTYLSSQFQSLKGRRGGKKAIMAVAGSMLTDCNPTNVTNASQKPLRTISTLRLLDRPGHDRTTVTTFESRRKFPNPILTEGSTESRTFCETLAI